MSNVHLYIMQGDGVKKKKKRKKQVFPFWDVKKEEETLCATSAALDGAQSSAGFHARQLNRG